MSLLRHGKAQVLTIYLGESDQWQGIPLYVAMIQFLREQGCAGATVTRAVAGYGAGSRLHESGGWRWSSDAPLVLQVIDQPDRLQRLLPTLQTMMTGGLMTLHEAEVLKYTHARTSGLPNKLLVRQIMETSITTVDMDTPVATVIGLLLDAPFRALPVMNRQAQLQGIISTGDLIRAGILPMRRGLVKMALELDTMTAEAIATPLERGRQSTQTAQHIMNRQVRTIGPQQPIHEAAHVMLETGLRRLPVVEQNGKLVGMLTRADLLQAIITSPLMSPRASSGAQPLRLTSSLSHIPVQQQLVAEYTNPDVATVSEQAPLADVIDALILSPFKRVIVIDHERRVKGIISDTDILARMQAEARPSLLTMLTGWARGKPARIPTGALQTQPGKARTAAEIMNNEVITVKETATIQETIEQMLATHRKLLPVLDTHGHLVGVVGRSDLLRVLVEGEKSV